MLRLTILSVALLFTSAVVATERPTDVASCCHGGEDLLCDGCNCDGHYQTTSCDGCYATVEPGTQEKHCWNIECNKICVPAIRFPWEAGGSSLTCFSWLKKRDNNSCCDTCSGDCGDACCATCVKPLCGEVRFVRDLIKEKYEVDTYEWNWQIRRLPACGECCGELESE